MRILVVDDHALVREALCGVLAELEPGATLVEAADAAGTMRRLDERADIGLVVLDLGLPDRHGLDVLAQLRRERRALPVVVLSASEARDDMVRALELGALGYVPKSASREVLLGAFALVLAGGVYVPPGALAPPGSGAPAGRPGSPEPSPEPSPDPVSAPALTERQAQVLALMMRGMSNKAICRHLGIAEATVKNHVTAILRALGAVNRTEAVIRAGPLLERAPHR